MPGAWELQPDVFCYTLHVDVVTFHWAAGIRRLRIPGRFQDIMGVSGMPFDHARNTATAHALAVGADYVFSLDSDVIPPPDTIYRLLRHNLPIVSGVYHRRSPPHAVPVCMRNGGWAVDLKPNCLEEVELVGSGCLLIRRDVLESVPAQRAGKRWFDWRVDLRELEDMGPHLSEDFTWNAWVRKHGYKIMVDTSIQCLHVGYAEASAGTFLPIGSTPGMPR